MGIRAGCCGELFSTRSPWQWPHSSGRSHIPCPVNGTRRARLGAEAGRAFTGLDSAQLGRLCKEGLFGAQPPRRHAHGVFRQLGGEKPQCRPPETPGMEEASGQPVVGVSCPEKTGMLPGGTLWQSQIRTSRCYPQTC